MHFFVNLYVHIFFFLSSLMFFLRKCVTFLLYKMQYAVQNKLKQTFENDPPKIPQSGVSRARGRDRERRQLLKLIFYIITFNSFR